MRRLLPLLVVALLAVFAAPASAVKDLGPHPVKDDCLTKYGTHETPKCFYGVEAVDFAMSDHLMRVGDVASFTINYGWDVNPNAFSPRHAELELGPGLQIVGGCTQSFFAPDSDHCTVIASAPTNGWVHHGYRFYFSGSYPYRSGDYYAIVSEGYEIAGTIMKLNAQGKYAPAAGEEVTIKKSDGTFTETVTTLKDGTYSRLVDPGTYSVRPRDTELCREPRQNGGCEHVATVTTGPDQDVSFASPDPVTISGSVTTADGEPLAGVTIHARPTGGRSRLFTTKKDGKYELKVPPGTTDIGSNDPLVCPKPVQDAGQGKCVNEKQITANNDVTVDFEKPGCAQKVDFENRMIAKAECFKETLKDTTWETDKKFWLNGIEMEPKGRTVFDKNAQTVTFEGGAVFYVQAGDVRFLVGGVIEGFVADFTATSFSVTTEGLDRFLPAPPNFGKFPITGAKLDLESEAGKTTLTTELTMPGNPAAQQQFTPIRFGEWPAAKPPPLAVTLKLATVNDTGVSSVAASVNRGFDLRVLEFNDLGIGYDISSKIWTFTGKGEATFLKGARTKGPSLKGTLGGTGIPFYSGVFTQLALGLDQLNRPLYGPLFIQRLGVGIDVNSVKPGTPFKFEASAGVSVGPRNPAPKTASIPLLGEVTVLPSEWLAIDGKFTVSGQAGAEDLETSNLTIAISGALKVFDKEVGTMTGKILPFVPGLSGEATFDFPDPFGGRFFTLHGTGGVWIDARQAEFKDAYYAEFDGTSSFPGSGSYRARGAITGRGIGVCFGTAGESWGWRYDWGTATPPIPGGCDLEEFKSAKPSFRTAVRAAAAANTFDLGGTEAVMAVEIPGKGAVPAVTVTGPGRLKLSTDGVKFGRKGDAILMPFPGRNSTYLFLPHPKAGRYKVTAAKGTKLGKLRYAKERPATDVTGELTGPACSPTLNWKQTPQAGQTLRFVEVSSLGTRILGEAKARSGKLKLAPLSGGGRSEVRALVVQGSLVRDTVTLGAYTAGADGTPASPRALKIKRAKGGKGTVSWTAGCGAAAYEVKVGTAKAVMAKSPKLAVKKLPKSGSVTVTSIAGDGKRGGSARMPLN